MTSVVVLDGGWLWLPDTSSHHIPGSSIWCLFLPLLKNSRIVAVLAEKTPFLKINAVVRNCQPTWSGIFAVWSGIFAVWSGIFAAEKRAWQQYIRRNSGLPKNVVLVKNLFIGQKAEIKPTLEEAGMLPSGKRLHNYGTSPLFIGRSTISMGHFQ